jgi:hypothetical protein
MIAADENKDAAADYDDAKVDDVGRKTLGGAADAACTLLGFVFVPGCNPATY